MIMKQLAEKYFAPSILNLQLVLIAKIVEKRKSIIPLSFYLMPFQNIYVWFWGD